MDWLARDRTFSTQPYQELAAVLVAAGHRRLSEDIRFAGHQRERAEAWKHGNLVTWFWLTLLYVFAGYGIGLYGFVALGWIIGLTSLGTLILGWSARGRQHSVWWRIGASLQRILPVLSLSQDFTKFFENPAPGGPGYEPRNLDRVQVALFALLALFGWILSIFLLAALSGLLDK
jgi:hypothetical protein